MTHGVLRKLDGYEVRCDAMRTTVGRFAPVYKLYRGTIATGVLIHRQDFPAPCEDFDTEGEAIDAAASQAIAWLEANH